MPTLLDYRRRIRSVKNTQQITRAMKFVAAAKLRRAQEGVFKARPYAKEIRRVLGSAMERVTEPQHPLLEKRKDVKSILLLVVTSDKGLCGAFNTNVLRKATEFAREHKGLKIQGLGIGRKAAEFLRRRRWNVAGEFINISMRVEFRHAKEIAERVTGLYTSEKVDEVHAIYNEFKSVMTQKLSVEKILPLEPEDPKYKPSEKMRQEGAATLTQVDYIYEESPNDIYAHLVPRYLDTEIFRVLLESAAAEHAARMTAMDSATNNAGELISDLTLEMNKIRQASITKELIEIVSGAASAAS